MEEDVAEASNSFTPLCVSTELHTAYVTCGIVEKVGSYTFDILMSNCE